MSSATGPAPVPKPSRQLPQRYSHHEFLPAALEILETPPSPVGMALIIIICALFAAALVWSYVGHVDIIAVAPGKLQPTGRSKIVQPLITDKVLAIHAKNGDRVKKGEILIELDPSESIADETAYAEDLASFQAEVLRREATIIAAQRHATNDLPSITWPSNIPWRVRVRAVEVLSADLLQLRSQVSSLDAEVRQKQVEKARLASTIVAQDALISTLQERVDMRRTLLEKAAGSKASLIDALENLEYQKTVLAKQIGQKAEAEASLDVLAKNIQKVYDTFIADNTQKLADAERQVGDLSEKLVKAHAITSHLLLRSPIDGVVQASTVTTVGQVVTSGEALMRIVPEDAPLEIEGYLPNKDIGFVKVGQVAIIKIEAFPFTRYGTVRAHVTRVARDAIPLPDANQIEVNPGQPLRTMSQGGGESTRNLVYPVTLKLERTDIDIDGKEIPLGAGMAVTAEISTGRRRILEYLFSPLVEISSDALRER